MDTQRIPNNLDVQGDLVVRGALPTYPRASLRQDDFYGESIPLVAFRVHDAFQTALGTAGTDDLGITAGAHGTGVPYLTAGDCKAAAVTRYGRAVVRIPDNYVAGESVRLVVHAGMLTTVSDGTATVDFQAFKVGTNALVSGADLVATAATTINSLTFADVAFNVTSTSLSPGDELDIKIAVACTDTATATAVIPAIQTVRLECDVKG